MSVLVFFSPVLHFHSQVFLCFILLKQQLAPKKTVQTQSSNSSKNCNINQSAQRFFLNEFLFSLFCFLHTMQASYSNCFFSHSHLNTYAISWLQLLIRQYQFFLQALTLSIIQSSIRLRLSLKENNASRKICQLFFVIQHLLSQISQKMRSTNAYTRPAHLKDLQVPP